MQKYTPILGDPHGPLPIAYDNNGEPFVDTEEIASKNAELIARWIVTFCADGKHWGGDCDYDGVVSMIWSEVQRLTRQQPVEMRPMEDGFHRVYGIDEVDTAREVAANRRKPISRRKALAVFDRDGYTCKHCGTRRNLTVDHIHPVSKGGTNDMDNLQTLCGSCNSRKGAKLVEDAA